MSGLLEKEGAHLVIKVVTSIILSHIQGITITPLEEHNVLVVAR